MHKNANRVAVLAVTTVCGISTTIKQCSEQRNGELEVAANEIIDECTVISILVVTTNGGIHEPVVE